MNDITVEYLKNPLLCPFCGEESLCVSPSIINSDDDKIEYIEGCASCEREIKILAKIIKVTAKNLVLRGTQV
mgnify:CR=1 FL=1